MIYFMELQASHEIYTLSLHDALPIFKGLAPDTRRARYRRRRDVLIAASAGTGLAALAFAAMQHPVAEDRKSTRLNSSHVSISYAVFCLKKKNKVSLAITEEKTTALQS